MSKRTGDLRLFWPIGIAFTLLSAAAGIGWTHGPDVFVMRATRSRSSDLLDALGGSLSTLGALEVSGALLLVLTAWLYKSGRRRLAGRLLLAFLLSGLLEYLLKHFLPVPQIPSVYEQAEDFAPLATVERAYPYPSGHALRATIVLGALYLLGRSGPLRARIALVLLGLLASRVYLGVHWVSDVVGGALMGAASVLWAFGKEERGWR